MANGVDDSELMNSNVVESAEDEGTAAIESPPNSGAARLTVMRGNQLMEEVFRFVPPATIGRFDPSHGPIDVDLGGTPEGQYVSRKHAQIVFEDGVYKLRDLESSNGTFIRRDDFERVEETELCDGDQIAFGNARFVFNCESEEGLSEALPDTSA